MNTNEKYDEMMEEINSANNLVEKDMLLQKYGLIDPKLTILEKINIDFEIMTSHPMCMIGTRNPMEMFYDRTIL